MKAPIILSLLVAAGTASAQSTYTTVTDNTLNLAAGLTTLTDTSAINANATATQLGYITDNSWSTTGINNIGAGTGGSLAGTFGGATYYNASNSIIIIGAYAGSVISWGSFDVSLKLSNGSYSPTVHIVDTERATLNPGTQTDPNIQIYLSNNNQTVSPGAPVNTAYILLQIAEFDTANIGITGIKMENFGSPYPDLTFIGVTGEAAAVPEPGTYGLGLGGLALAVVALRRRAKK